MIVDDFLAGQMASTHKVSGFLSNNRRWTYNFVWAKPLVFIEMNSNTSCVTFIVSRKHTGEKKYACEVCGERFFVHGHMKRHLYSHTGIKPHACR